MIIPPIHLPFLHSDIPHSQDLQIAQVVKDPGRKRGESVTAKFPIDSTPESTTQSQPHEEKNEGEGK